MRIAALVTLASALAGCADPGPPTPANLVHAAQTADASGGNVFQPATLTIRAGERVTWDVLGEGHHTVDFLDAIDTQGTIPKSGNLAPGETFDARFPDPGTYRYYCKYHSNKETGMVGTIIVE